jgi:hypothetical protein
VAVNAPDLKIVFKKKAPAGDGAEPDESGYEDDAGEGDGGDDEAKLSALRKFKAALDGDDESAALEAFERLVYHCTEG